MDRQMSIFQGHMMLHVKQQDQLARGWAHVFRTEVMPIIPESAFAPLYCPDNGRPNFPVAVLVGLFLIKEIRNLTDSELLHAFHYDLEVLYALGLAPGEHTLAPRTLYYFRGRIAKTSLAMQTFETLTGEMIRRLGVETGRQRLDSTQVCSNIANLSRLGLFVRTIETFVGALAKHGPEEAASLPRAMRTRYLERSGYFADTTGRKSRARLEAAARDVGWLVGRFRDDPAVAALPSFSLLARLFAEQCEVVHAPGSDPVAVPLPADEVASTSLQSPSDPDATYSAHKGKGYQVQIGETCAPENPVQMITHLAVEGAHESDHGALEPFLDATEARGIGPDEVLADTAYASGENLARCLDRGVDLVAPMPGAKDADDVGLADFTIDFDSGQVRACPEGHAPDRQRPMRNGTGMNARFDPAVCARCELGPDCPAGRNRGRLRFTRADLLVAHGRLRESTDAFRDQYKVRSGVERTNAELKSAHGLGRLRVRGRQRVTLAVIFKVLACNVKRFCRCRARQIGGSAPATDPNALVPPRLRLLGRLGSPLGRWCWAIAAERLRLRRFLWSGDPDILRLAA